VDLSLQVDLSLADFGFLVDLSSLVDLSLWFVGGAQFACGFQADHWAFVDLRLFVDHPFVFLLFTLCVFQHVNVFHRRLRSAFRPHGRRASPRRSQGRFQEVHPDSPPRQGWSS
jgi:hypothetical protein